MEGINLLQWPLYLRGKGPASTELEGGLVPEAVWMLGRGYIYISHLPGIEIFPGRPSRSLVCIRTALFRLSIGLNFIRGIKQYGFLNVSHIRINSTRRKQLQELVNTGTLQYGLVEELLYP
jgi:hypothetical protein